MLFKQSSSRGSSEPQSRYYIWDGDWATVSAGGRVTGKSRARQRRGRKWGIAPSHLIILWVKMSVQEHLKVTHTQTGRTRGILLLLVSPSCPSSLPAVWIINTQLNSEHLCSDTSSDTSKTSRTAELNSFIQLFVFVQSSRAMLHLVM